MNSILSIWIVLLIACASASGTNQVAQEINLSEFEYKIIDMEDYMLDYSMKTYSSNCDAKLVDIVSSTGDKFVEEAQPSLESQVIGLIVFASKRSLSINTVALLSNASLATYIDDASVPDASASNLINLKVFPIAGQSTCSHLQKVSSVSFLFECTSQTVNSDGTKTVSLYVYSTTTDFSSADGIDLSQLTPNISVLQFDPRTQFPLKSSQRLLEQTAEKKGSKNVVSSSSRFSQQDLINFAKDIEEQSDSTSDSGNETSDPDTETNYSLTPSDDTIESGPSDADNSEYLTEYYNCEKQTSFYQNVTSKMFNYYRVCKYHETQMKANSNDASNQYLSYVAGFVELYNLKGIQNGIVQGAVIYYSDDDDDDDYRLSLQGIQQYADKVFVLLDFDDGLLFYYSVDSKDFVCFPYFLKYLYGQKFLNIYLKINQDLEFTLQDTNPNELVINTEGYIVSYQIDFSNPIIHISPYPITVSIAHFVDQVKYIHSQNANPTSGQLTTFLSRTNAENMKSIFYDFDEYLYYVTITYVDQQTSYYLIINRSLVDDQTDMTMNPTAIELDYLSSSEYSQLFHYRIPGLFQNNVPSRVRLFEQRAVSSQDTTMQLLLTTFLWKSSSSISLNTKEFNIYSSCLMSLTFSPKDGSQAQGNKQTLIQVNLIPRMFKGVISKKGLHIPLSFSNPQPYFPIKDWFFGASVQYSYEFTGSSMNAQINVISSTSATLNKEQDTATNACTSQILNSLQTSNGYFVFHQSSSCSLWFEQCLVYTSYDKIKFTDATNYSQTNQCIKSSEISLTNQISSLTFDGNILVISYQQKEQVGQVSQTSGTLFFGNVKTSFSSGNVKSSDTQSTTGQLTQFDLGGEILAELDSLKIFTIPNTSLFGAIIQSSSKQFKTLVTFKISTKVTDITMYTFDDDILYSSYETSLLDQGFLFAAQNQNPNESASPVINIYKVNFLTNKCIIQESFSQSDMIQQIQEIQTNFQQSNDDGSSLSDDDSFVNKGIVLINDPTVFMNTFDIRIWRNNETQPYRLLLVDYSNNCLFDYYLYDIIKPKFIRQIDLFDFTITDSQSLEIANNMLVLKLSKDKLVYFVSLEINGESINQISSINLFSQDKAASVSSILKSSKFQYQEGNLCQVFSSPQSQIVCIFNPFIRLNYDFSTSDSSSKLQSDSSSSSSSSTASSTSSSSQENSSDKQVSFNMSVQTTLAQIPQKITLQTVFSNFDTNLITTNSNGSTSPYSYDVKQSISIRGEQTKMRYLPLDTSFVSGSIDQYYVNYFSSENKSQLKDKYNVTVQGYIDTASVKKSVLSQESCTYMDKSDKNPYQLVCLTKNQISVINQNLKFNFENIYSIKYADIKVQPAPASTFPFLDFTDRSLAYVSVTVVNCSSIFSNEVQVSQTTSTFLYILKCLVVVEEFKPFNQFLAFSVDVNQFDSLVDQGADWKKALTQNIKVMNVDLNEEAFYQMTDEIRDFSLISLTDDLNNIAGYIFLMVREIQEEDGENDGDYRVYILWGLNNVIGPTFYLEEINQINSSDLNLNYLIIQNFVAQFPYDYPGQCRLDLSKQSDFVFNIGWDDGKRYVTVALLKLRLPPLLDNYVEDDDISNKKVFNVQFYDIYGSEFDQFVKPSETWKSTLTSLKSTITFQTNSYNASVLITNEFSIVELSCVLSPAPFLTNSQDNTSGSSTTQDILIFTQYAWCENQFSNDEVKQQILKYKQFLIVKCVQSTPVVSSTGSILAETKAKAEFILKIYKTNQDDSLDEQTTLPSSQNKYSMAQSISLDEGKTISAMSFRSDNKALFLDLILSDFSDPVQYEVQQYPVNTIPILVFNADILDQTEIQVCASNHFSTAPCENAVFSNIIIDTSNESLHQWMLFSGLVAVPLFLTICFIFGSFVGIKKLRKGRQDEFLDLLKNQSQNIYKSKNDLSFLEKSSDGDEKLLQMSESNNNENFKAPSFQQTNHNLNLSTNIK